MEYESSFRLLLFSADPVVRSKAELEHAENGLAFQSGRDARSVASDLAAEELRKGNVCFDQARLDLQAALRRKQLIDLCKKVFRDELAEAEQAARREKLSPDFLRCEAAFEAYSGPGEALKLKLSLRGRLMMHEPLPPGLRRAGFREDVESRELTPWEDVLGEAPGWKGALGSGACTLDEKRLDGFLRVVLSRSREARELARCRSLEFQLVDKLRRLQRRFKEYVPDDWVRRAGGSDSAGLLAAPGDPDTYATLSDCKKSRERHGEALERLEKLAAKIADKHDVPALLPESRSRQDRAEADGQEL